MMIIETQGVTRRFGRQTAVDNVDFSLPEGAALALVGANGAGKTTLLRLMLNILRPSGGTARVFGRDSTDLKAGDFERIGYVSENMKLPARLSVGHYFDYLRPLYRTWDAELEKDLRDEFNLPADRKINKLSHGMRVKTMLTSVLAFRPPLLVLDEPLGGLDPAVRDDVLEGLIGRAGDTTILMSTHELTDIEGFATHVAFMESGVLLFQDETETLSRRMREIHVTLPTPCDPPPDLPAGWRGFHASGRTLRFVDHAFRSAEDLREQLDICGFSVERLDIRPLSLREIAVTYMRGNRQENGK